MTSCLPRRPTASIRRPVTPAANAGGSPSRSVPGHADARADDHRAGPAAVGQQVAPEIARDGLDLGKLGHRP